MFAVSARATRVRLATRGKTTRSCVHADSPERPKSAQFYLMRGPRAGTHQAERYFFLHAAALRLRRSRVMITLVVFRAASAARGRDVALRGGGHISRFQAKEKVFVKISPPRAGIACARAVRGGIASRSRAIGRASTLGRNVADRVASRARRSLQSRGNDVSRADASPFSLATRAYPLDRGWL